MVKTVRSTLACASSLVLLLHGCGSGTGGNTATVCNDAASLATTKTVGASGSNVMNVTVGSGSLCSTQYNFPCTSVTICPVGSTSGCQTLSDILVDTGSYGLRIYASALNATVCKSLTSLTDSLGNAIGECATFGGFSTWGAVVAANVQLGGEVPVKTSIQIIDKSFSTVPTTCGQVASSPLSSGFNGILGVGLQVNDCGIACTQTSDNKIYFSCPIGSTCSGTTVTSSSQVTNPVTLLSSDNNGVVLSLPSVSSQGTSSIAGSLYLGIGTQTNNTPSSVTTYQADSNDYIQTRAFSNTYSASYIDSGANTLSFPTNSGVVVCSSSKLSSFYCPTSLLSETATNTSSLTGYSGSVSFSVVSASGIGSNVAVYGGLSSVQSGSTSAFTWGLPFFLGRTVYVGIQGQTSILGTGPYWAY